VGRAESAAGKRHHRLDQFGIADIDLACGSLAARGDDRFAHSPGGVLFLVGQDDGCAFRGKAGGDGNADAVAGAGDDGDLVGESLGHG